MDTLISSLTVILYLLNKVNTLILEKLVSDRLEIFLKPSLQIVVRSPVCTGEQYSLSDSFLWNSSHKLSLKIRRNMIFPDPFHDAKKSLSSCASYL